MFKISRMLDALRRSRQQNRMPSVVGRTPEPPDEVQRILSELDDLLTRKPYDFENEDYKEWGIIPLIALCYKLEKIDIPYEMEIESILEENKIMELVRGKFKKLVLDERWLLGQLRREASILKSLARKINQQMDLISQLGSLLLQRQNQSMAQRAAARIEKSQAPPAPRRGGHAQSVPASILEYSTEEPKKRSLRHPFGGKPAERSAEQPASRKPKGQSEAIEHGRRRFDEIE